MPGCIDMVDIDIQGNEYPSYKLQPGLFAGVQKRLGAPIESLDAFLERLPGGVSHSLWPDFQSGRTWQRAKKCLRTVPPHAPLPPNLL